MNTAQTSLRWAGFLFLLAFGVYGTGMGLASRVLEASDPVASLVSQPFAFRVGLVLMALNAFIVAGIGGLCFRPLASFSRRLAWFYVSVRLAEGLALLEGTLIMVPLLLGAPTLEALGTAHRGHLQAYHMGMAILGVGSMVWCGFLFRRRVIPRWLAAWGVAGYGVFALGSLLALGGLGDGLLLSIPGGLFEVVFGVWLLARPSAWGRALPTQVVPVDSRERP